MWVGGGGAGGLLPINIFNSWVVFCSAHLPSLSLHPLTFFTIVTGHRSYCCYRPPLSLSIHLLPG